MAALEPVGVVVRPGVRRPVLAPRDALPVRCASRPASLRDRARLLHDCPPRALPRSVRRILQVAPGKADAAEWIEAGRGAALRITLKTGQVVVLDQFKRTDRDAVAAALTESTSTDLADGQVGASGRNFGTVAIGSSTMDLVDQRGRRMASLPLSAVAQVMAPTSHEIEVQLQEDDTLEREDEALVEMRLFFPPGHGELDSADKAAQDGAVTSAALASGRAEPLEGEDSASGTPAERVRARLISAAGIHGAVGEAAAEFPERVGAFLAPRGRYAVEVYPTFLRLVGKSNEFKVTHAKISRMFYLPRPGAAKDEDGNPLPDRFYFVISLQDPLRQGQQRYPHLVMNLTTDQFECRLNCTPERLRDLKLPAVVSDALPMTIAKVLKAFTGKKLFR